MLGFVKYQEYLALAKIKPEIAQDPVDRAHADRPAALRHPLHQVQRADSLTNVDVIGSSAFSVLGNLREVQLRDQVLQDVGLLRSGGDIDVMGTAMIQCLVEISSQQTNILRLVELACADDGSCNGMGSNEVANRCPDEPVVGGDC